MSSATPLLLLSLAAVCVQLSQSQGQALHKLWERQAEQTALLRLKEHPNLRKDVLEAMGALEDLWTALPEMVENNVTVSEACHDSALKVLFGSTHDNVLNIAIPDIVLLLDATGKQGAGLVGGNFIMNGAFDECFQYDFTGYCMGKVKPALIPDTIPLSWTIGLCVPKHCSASDVTQVINFLPGLEVVESGLLPMLCTDTKTPPYSPGSIVMMVVCAVFAVLVAMGTVLDKILEYITTSSEDTGYVAINNGATVDGSGEKMPLLTRATTARTQSILKVKWHEFITVFSLYKTVPTLLATKQGPGVITSMNGLRVISMFWVILGHTYVWSESMFDNVFEIQNLVKRFSFLAVLNGVYSVDSFFFLSGVLVAYLTLRQMKKRNGRFPFLHYYIHRYLRLTPTYAFVLFFAWFLAKHIAVGPTITLIDSFALGCEKYWWTNLLYINNLYPWKMSDQCIAWSWYLANDMQFFIISPLMLIPAYFLLPLGVIVSSAFLLCSFVVTAALVGVFNLPMTVVNPDPTTAEKYMDYIYETPWARIQPYIVGLVLGYILYNGIRLPFRRSINALLYLLMWIAAAVLLASPVYGIYPLMHGHVPSSAENIMYVTFSRFSWGLGLALLVFACHNGYGGPINSFLSMKIWTPLSRMTFNAYLVHPIVLTLIFGQLQTSIHLTDITMGTYAVAFVVISYAVAGVVCVAVEFPLGSLEMLLFKLLGLEGRKSQRQAGAEGQEERMVTEQKERRLTGEKLTNA